jgi:hypothetical protein
MLIGGTPPSTLLFLLGRARAGIRALLSDARRCRPFVRIKGL